MVLMQSVLLQRVLACKCGVQGAALHGVTRQSVLALGAPQDEAHMQNARYDRSRRVRRPSALSPSTAQA